MVLLFKVPLSSKTPHILTIMPQIQWVENRINNTPMKVLNFMTPNEAMEQESNRYKFRRFKSSKEASVALQLRM